jgi:hypothetical protein
MLGVKFVRYTSRAADFEHSETTFCTGCKSKVTQLVDVFILYLRDSTLLENQLKPPELSEKLVIFLTTAKYGNLYSLYYKQNSIL